MGHMDQGIKALLDLRTEDVVSFALPTARYLGALPPDVATEPQLVLDSLYRIFYQGMDCAVNIEAQARADATMPRRMFEYGARASIVHQLPVISIVLWLFKGKTVPRPPYQMYAGNRLVATWDFINIELYKLSASAIINAGVVGLLPLVPFTQGASAEVVELAKTWRSIWSGGISCRLRFCKSFRCSAR